MGFLSSGNVKTQITKYSGMQVQSTSSAVPVPIVYGQNILAPNILWYQNFQAHPQKSGKGGGKGGGSSRATSWTYSADIIMGVCEGPVSQIAHVWQSSPIPTTLTAMNLSFFNGATPQSVWSYLASKYPGEALSYPGTCYVAAANFSLGSSATVNENNFEVYGILCGSGFNGIDADPAQVIYDLLTNAQYGVGFPAASISSDSLFNAAYGYQNYCRAVGIAISPVLNSQEQGSSILARWLQLTNSTAIWSDGLLKIIPFGDASISANGATWSPGAMVLYSLSDDDYIHSDGEDPIQITRSDPYKLPNWQSVEISARSDNYGTGPVTARDQSMIDRFGLKVGSTVTGHEITAIAIGQTIAQLVLQRGLYIRRTFKFKLGEEFCLLEPMDLVALTDSNLGLVAEVVRVTEIEEDDAGVLTVTAEEYPDGVGSAVVYPTQGKTTGAPTSSTDAVAINAPLLFEPPKALTDNAVQIWAAVSPLNADPNWGGCIVWASVDGTSYAQIDVIRGAARQGALSANLAAFSGANPDTADTLSVDLTMSGGALESSTAAAASSGVSMCYAGGEYLSYTTATLTAANRYNLTGLYRGQAGIASTANASGAAFCFLDSSILKYTVPSAEIGQTIWLKFQSFNLFGSGLQDLAGCSAYSYAVQGTGQTGPVASTLTLGVAMDFGAVSSDAIVEYDDFGYLAGAVTSIIDLGGCL